MAVATWEATALARRRSGAGRGGSSMRIRWRPSTDTTVGSAPATTPPLVTSGSHRPPNSSSSTVARPSRARLRWSTSPSTGSDARASTTAAVATASASWLASSAWIERRRSRFTWADTIAVTRRNTSRATAASESRTTKVCTGSAKKKLARKKAATAQPKPTRAPPIEVTATTTTM